MVLRSFIAVLALVATLVPAFAQQRQVRIGIGYGLAFLPLYICEDLRLIEKYAKAAQLDIKVSFPRLNGAAQVQSELDSQTIDMGPFGTAPLLAAWDEAKNTPQQIVAVSGITSLPLTLLSDQPDEHSLADLKPSDRIAVPTLTSPQMQLLDMQSEKILGRYDRLRGQVVVLSHADAVDALGEGASQEKAVTAYFASPPYTEIALRGANVHPILTSSDVIGGKFSFLVLGCHQSDHRGATANAGSDRQGHGRGRPHHPRRPAPRGADLFDARAVRRRSTAQRWQRLLATSKTNSAARSTACRQWPISWRGAAR